MNFQTHLGVPKGNIMLHRGLYTYLNDVSYPWSDFIATILNFIRLLTNKYTVNLLSKKFLYVVLGSDSRVILLPSKQRHDSYISCTG